jgi:hypothetical protein
MNLMVLKPALRYLAQIIRIVSYTPLCYAFLLEHRASNSYPDLLHCDEYDFSGQALC